MVESFKLLTRPEGRKAHDWAAKNHITNSPAMYHRYLLWELNTSQLTHKLEEEYGGVGDRPEAGEWLVKNVFRKGAVADRNESLPRATGVNLRPKYFVRGFVHTIRT